MDRQVNSEAARDHEYVALGRAIAQRQEAMLSHSRAVHQARARLFGNGSIGQGASGLGASPPARRPWRAAMLAAMTVTAVTTALSLWAPWGSSSLTFTEGDVNGVVGRSIEAETRRSLTFSDGTAIDLRPGTSMRVERVDEHGAEVALQRGRLTVSVTHAASTQWVFRAGGYHVAVTGTEFELGWSEILGRFDLRMVDGRVLVTGPGLSVPREVVAGEAISLRRDGTPSHEGSVEGETAAEASDDDDRTEGRAARDARRSEPHGSSEEGEGSAQRVPPAPPSEPTSHGREKDAWQALADDGHYDEAFASVADRLPRLMASADAATLLRLANVARLSGHLEEARGSHLAVRKRHAGSPAAAQSAFELGAMAFGRDDAEANAWLRTYLAEAPSGGLVEAARGRLLELARRGGDPAAAARDYLRHHPDGPHAALARAELRRGSKAGND